MKYYITDVFSLGKYSGNQLATFILDKELSTELMQKIAQEVNYSETTFIIPKKRTNKGYDVRVFTPKAEIDFAGHPTLGTAFIAKRFIEDKDRKIVKLNFKVGQIPVEVRKSIFWMKQVQPEFTETMDHTFIARMLNLDVDDLETVFPVQGVTTGLPFTIVPLVNRDALERAKLNMDVYEEFIKTTWAKGILVFCRGGYSPLQDLSSRVFVPWLGITEDPATGSATGCLAAWLLKNKFYGTDFISINVAQGYQIDRKSELCVEAGFENDKYDIKVGGEVELIAQGEWEE